MSCIEVVKVLAIVVIPVEEMKVMVNSRHRLARVKGVLKYVFIPDITAIPWGYKKKKGLKVCQLGTTDLASKNVSAPGSVLFHKWLFVLCINVITLVTFSN